MGSLSTLLSECRDQALDDWRLAPRTAGSLFLLPFAATVVAAVLSVGFKPQMRFLEQEDGVLEWVQVLAFAASAVAAAALVPHLLRRGRRLAGVAYCLLAAGLVFVVGEELAWGQRLLHFETPEALAAVNEKEELSLHNIESLTSVERVLKLVAATYGLLGAWWLLRLRRQGRDDGWRPFLLPAFLASPFLVVFAMRIARLTFLRDRVPTGFSEFEETVIAFGVAAFCLLFWRRERLSAAG